ncbi:hypothetical protein [Nonomuraea roseola]|uniref:Uncharacterized protein n=1 Tax=Nonomuraea roseola TaxID=46179 RepID=A0ABV5Q8P7_9ACTN
MTAADIGLIPDLKHAAGTIDHPRSLVMRDELEEKFRSAAFAPERDAVIDVDAESPTGTLGLYQGLDFTITDRAVSLVKRF